MSAASTKLRSAYSLKYSLAIFLVSFFALQLGWNQARGTRLEHWVIDDATVRTSVALINSLTPEVAALASGPSVVAPGGGINVRNGCEGTEVLFLLLAALLTYSFPWWLRLLGAGGGALFIFVLNQLRLLALFYSLRSDRVLFDRLHGLIAPLLLIVLTLAFFVALREWDLRRRAIAAHG